MRKLLVITQVALSLALLIGTYSRLPPPIFVSHEEEPLGAWNTMHFYSAVQSGQRFNRYSVWLSFLHVKDVFGPLFQNWLSRSESFGEAITYMSRRFGIRTTTRKIASLT